MTYPNDLRAERTTIEQQPLRSKAFAPPRRRWPGLAGAGLLGAAIAAVAVVSLYDGRGIGAPSDDRVATAGAAVQAQADALKGAVADAGRDIARASEAATERASTAISDAAITAAVKAALAADPGLSALRVEVNTEAGVVRLEGPAPNEEARRRAEMLAAAPDGVRSVDNRLVVSHGQPSR